MFKKLRAVGGILILCGLNRQPFELLKTTQLHRIIKIVRLAVIDKMRYRLLSIVKF